MHSPERRTITATIASKSRISAISRKPSQMPPSSRQNKRNKKINAPSDPHTHPQHDATRPQRHPTPHFDLHTHMLPFFAFHNHHHCQPTYPFPLRHRHQKHPFAASLLLGPATRAALQGAGCSCSCRSSPSVIDTAQVAVAGCTRSDSTDPGSARGGKTTCLRRRRNRRVLCCAVLGTRAFQR